MRKGKTMTRKYTLAVSITLFGISLAIDIFHIYGSLKTRSFLEGQGFRNVDVGVYLAEDRCYPSQYFRYSFEATFPGRDEQVVGEVCGDGDETHWDSSSSPLGHFGDMHTDRKKAVIKDFAFLVLAQLVFAPLLIITRKEKQQ